MRKTEEIEKKESSLGGLACIIGAVLVMFIIPVVSGGFDALWWPFAAAIAAGGLVIEGLRKLLGVRQGGCGVVLALGATGAGFLVFLVTFAAVLAVRGGG